MPESRMYPLVEFQQYTAHQASSLRFEHCHMRVLLGKPEGLLDASAEVCCWCKCRTLENQVVYSFFHFTTFTAQCVSHVGVVLPSI